eukprot:61418-Alexandrium_andersonii.AAC.1
MGLWQLSGHTTHACTCASPWLANPGSVLLDSPERATRDWMNLERQGKGREIERDGCGEKGMMEATGGRDRKIAGVRQAQYPV